MNNIGRWITEILHKQNHIEPQYNKVQQPQYNIVQQTCAYIMDMQKFLQCN